MRFLVNKRSYLEDNFEQNFQNLIGLKNQLFTMNANAAIF